MLFTKRVEIFWSRVITTIRILTHLEPRIYKDEPCQVFMWKFLCKMIRYSKIFVWKNVLMLLLGIKSIFQYKFVLFLLNVFCELCSMFLIKCHLLVHFCQFFLQPAHLLNKEDLFLVHALKELWTRRSCHSLSGNKWMNYT